MLPGITIYIIYGEGGGHVGIKHFSTSVTTPLFTNFHVLWESEESVVALNPTSAGLLICERNMEKVNPLPHYRRPE